MKKYIYLIASIALIFTSCKEDENLTEYPGNIIIHGSTFLNSFGSEINSDDARIRVFSGIQENDLSLLNGEDFTYELWFRANEDCNIGNISTNGEYAQGASVSSRANNFELYLVNDPDGDFSINYGRLDGLNNHIGTMSSVDAEENLHFNEWVHVAISRSSSDGISKFYINGKLIDSSSDPLWIQPANNDTIWCLNYMVRSGVNMNFFIGSLDNVRASLVDRYPTEFTPNILLHYNESIDELGETIINPIDENTLIQLDLDNHLTEFLEGHIYYEDFKKIEVKGIYDYYYVRIHNDFFSWDSEILDEYPVTGY